MIADNEARFDSEVHPLMDQIHALCRQYNIPYAATFQLTGGRDPVFSSSAWTPEETDETVAAWHRRIIQARVYRDEEPRHA